MSLMSGMGQLKPFEGMKKIRMHLTKEVHKDTTAMI
jgi:hypothetical protein